MVDDMDHLILNWAGILIYVFFFVVFAVTATYFSNKKFEKKKKKQVVKVKDTLRCSFNNVINFGDESIVLNEDNLNFFRRCMKNDSKIVTVDQDEKASSQNKTSKVRSQYFICEGSNLDGVIILN